VRPRADLERTEGLLWIPVCAMPEPPRARAGRLTLIVFFTPGGDGSPPSIRHLTGAEAAKRLYAALNPLARPRAGLAAATAVAARVPSFEITRGELPAMCTRVARAHRPRSRELRHPCAHPQTG
jgi:hypothetical protein